MQNWSTTASKHNADDVKQPHPQVATATNQHDATGTATENHSGQEEYDKVHHENPFEDPNYCERFGDGDRNKFTIEQELSLRKCKKRPMGHKEIVRGTLCKQHQPSSGNTPTTRPTTRMH